MHGSSSQAGLGGLCVVRGNRVTLLNYPFWGKTECQGGSVSRSGWQGKGEMGEGEALR